MSILTDWKVSGKYSICIKGYLSVQFSSVTQSCLTFYDPMDCSMPGLSVHHQLPDFTQTQVHFLEEISSLSHSIVLLYFFPLITEEGFLISPCYSLELYIQMGISFLFSFVLASPLFTAICKASSDNHFAFLHFFFWGMVLLPVSCTVSQTYVHNSSGTLSMRS